MGALRRLPIPLAAFLARRGPKRRWFSDIQRVHALGVEQLRQFRGGLRIPVNADPHFCFCYLLCSGFRGTGLLFKNPCRHFAEPEVLPPGTLAGVSALIEALAC